MRPTILLTCMLSGLTACHPRSHAEPPAQRSDLPIVPLPDAMCRTRGSFPPQAITSAKQLEDAMRCGGDDRDVEFAAPPVDWRREWIHLDQFEPFSAVTDVDVRATEIVVTQQLQCPGGTQPPPYDLALALPLPVRPVRVERKPHGGECEQVP